MAKRFTDTNKWDQSWFRKLTPKMKAVWSYACDKCDHAGILEVDYESMSFNVNEEVTEKEFKDTFQDRVKFLTKDKCFIQAFIDFQYGKLDERNRVHRSVISILEKYEKYKPLSSPLLGDKDKDKDMDKDKDSLNPNTAKTVPKTSTDPKIMADLISEWGQTMTHFKIAKDPIFDEIAIAGLLARHGFEKTRLALIGARYEEPTSTFSPAKNLTVGRISKPNIFEKLVTLGAMDHEPVGHESDVEDFEAQAFGEVLR
jgi:hypothetical protein